MDGNQKVAGGITAQDIDDIAHYKKTVNDVIHGMGAGATQARKQVQDYISENYHDFSASNYNAFQKMNSDYKANGTTGNGILYANRALKHLSDLYTSFQTLNNGNSEWWNDIKNLAANNKAYSLNPDRAEAINRFNTIKTGALDEVAKAVR